MGVVCNLQVAWSTRRARREHMASAVKRSCPESFKMQSHFARRSIKFARWGVLWLALLAVKSGIADSSKISPDLLPLLSNPSKSVDVIIQYNSKPPTCAIGELLCSAGSLLGGVLDT